MKLVIKRKLPKRRTPHRPTKAEPPKVRYDRKKAKKSLREELMAEREQTAENKDNSDPVPPVSEPATWDQMKRGRKMKPDMSVMEPRW